MKISYDYEEMIQELKEDVMDGVLSLTDTIQILRSDETFDDGYKPIIDWYYGDESEDETQMKERYEKDKPNLSNILVEDCLAEMEERNAII